jgi:exopolyphosphatase/guanosine-5'-triphosphate,3'-diphosphate pyrophosphatase
VNPDPGGLTVEVRDRTVGISMTGGGRWELPVGPLSLLEELLGDRDPPLPEDLTNALGLVHDHFDDIVVTSPIVMEAPSLLATGPHVTMLARVELGREAVPSGYRLLRRDADEVFRTLVAETAEERRHNPGLDPDHAESIVGTCCVILAIMRRLDSAEVGIEPTGGGGR